MKKILFLLCCIQTLLFGQSVGPEITTVPAKYEGELPHGIWSWGYKDSTSGKKIVYDIDFVLSDTTDNNKTIKEIQIIHKGLMNGVSKEYWPNGRLRGEVSYKQGVADGIVKSYSADGVLLTQLLYVDGEEDMNYPERYISDRIDYDTSYVGFNQPIWRYHAKYDTIAEARYDTLRDTIIILRDSLVKYYKNDILYKENKYNYQRRLYSTTTYTKRMKDTVYDFYTKKNYNGIKCIYYYQEGKLTKQIFYNTKGRIQKPRIRGKGK
ncbi:MAG: hypothetical protein J6W84_05945 [Bacteroidales bacterium]|nr:hypothetical protein [Bacteroidales bacterium]